MKLLNRPSCTVKLTVLLVILFNSSFAQDLIWSQDIFSDDIYGDISRIQNDVNGNMYFLGSANPLVKPKGNDPEWEVTSSSGYQYFYGKYASDGSFEWVREFNRLSGSFSVVEIEMHKHKETDFFLLYGYLRGTVDLDPHPQKEEIISASESRGAAVIMKIDAETGYLLDHFVYTGSLAYVRGITLMEDNSVIIAGETPSDFDLDGYSCEVARADQVQIFLHSLSPSLNTNWINFYHTLSSTSEYGLNLSGMDANQNGIYLFGEFREDLKAGDTTIYTDLNDDGYRSQFLMKCNATGEIDWLKNTAQVPKEPSGRYGYLRVNSEAECFIYSNFNDNTFNIDGTPSVNLVRSNARGDTYLRKFNADGEHEWYMTFRSSDFCEPRGFDFSEFGDLILPVQWDESLAISAPTFNRYKTAVSNTDLMFLKINSDGEILWEKVLTNPSWDPADGLIKLRNLSAGNGSEFFISGEIYSGTYDIDPGENEVIYAEGGFGSETYFLAKYGICSISSLDIAQNEGVIEASLEGASYQWLDCSNGFSPILGAEGRSLVMDQSSSETVV